ncbi:Uma2 family endonuclease [Candidatus Poribacteria bacterium]|nr:Uma2 family endonuclease [Candidatus Poribacteria bacterium]
MKFFTYPLEKPKEVIYPESDGKPMAETDAHIDQIIDLRKALQAYYRDNPMVYISGNIFIYYLENDTREQVSPDLFVVKGVPKHRRRYYQTWVEGKAPDFVLEVTSKKTTSEDFNYKYELYERILKVPEYFLFDPAGKYLHPPLQGHRLVSGRYSPIVEIDGCLRSEELKLELHVEHGPLEEIPESTWVLRIYDPLTGEMLFTVDELEEELQELEETLQRETVARLEAEARARREAEARLEVELELERLRKELEMLRA